MIKDKPAKTQQRILSEIANRWSPRAFSSKDISDDDLATLFEAARWAPSSNNYQPWRFMVARKDSPTWKKMFACLAEFNQQWVDTAPVLVFTAYKKTFDDGKENFHALHDLGLAVATLGLQAQSMDIALHQMAGVDWKKAHSVFDIPDDFHVTTAIAIGQYGGELSELPSDLQEQEVQKRERKPINEIMQMNEFPF